MGLLDWLKILLHLISGPDKARILTDFEETLMKDVTDSAKHDEGASSEVSFQKEARNLFETIDTLGNLFAETSIELMNLHSHDYAEETVIKSVRSLESLGQEQYVKFKEDVFQKQTRKIDDTLRKNNLPLFSTPKRKKSTKAMQLKGLCNDVSLFGQLYIANQQRG